MFKELRDEFCKKLENVSVDLEKKCWDFYINSTPENMQKYEDAQDNYSKLFRDKKTYEKFQKIDKNSLSKHEAKQLKNLLKEFDEELNTGEELKKLRQKENEIAKKFNSYVLKIDDKEITKTEVTKILQNEENPEIRRKAHKAKIACGDLISDDMIEFVKMRNEYAKTKGYENYFEYKLKEDYEVENEFLEKLIDEVYSKTQNTIKEIQMKKQNDLKNFFNVDELKPYHYGLLLSDNPEKAVNEVLDKNDITLISKNMYKKMGYDVDKMVADCRLTLDLFPRKGKNTHGFCFGVKAGKDSRILANLTNNVISLDTLNHEMGHCVYDLGIDTKLPFLDRTAASPAVTEAVAMMMGDVIKRENVLAEFLDKDLLEKFKNSIKEDEVSFVSKSLLIIDFEREFYSNPNQNPAELWNNLRGKYLNRFEVPDNEWATIPHYLSHPAYYQNYFRANLMKAQIYNYLKSKLGDITENSESAKFMDENIFALGASIDEYELIEKLTGKEFSADDFVEGVLMSWKLIDESGKLYKILKKYYMFNIEQILF